MTAARDVSVGAALPDESAVLHVTGAREFVDDIREPAGTLHAALALSPVAHGRLRPVDLGRVRALPGVVDVLSAADVPGENDCGTIVHDEPVLAADEVTYLGQPVLAVVATTHAAALHAATVAAGLLQADPLPMQLDHRTAHADGEHVIAPMLLARSTTAATVSDVIAAAPHRLQGTFDCGGQEHAYLEGQVAFAIPLDDGAMLVHSSTQHPTEVQKLVARTLGLTANRVRVLCRRMGGGFGGKESQAAQYACIAAIAARRLGRPVKLRLDRYTDDLATGKRHAFWFEYDVGYDDDGRILGYDLTLVSQAGHSADLSGPVLTRALCHVDNAYWLPDVRMRGFAARTNTQSSTAFRGFGGPQGALVTEYVLDSIARQLGRWIRSTSVGPTSTPRRTPRRRATRGASRPTASGSRTTLIHELVDGARAVQRLPRPAASGGGVQRRQRGPQARDRPDAGQVRHLLQRHPVQPGRRAGPRLRRRQRRRQPLGDRDGPGRQHEGAPGRGRRAGRPDRLGAVDGDRHREGREHLRDRGVHRAAT